LERLISFGPLGFAIFVLLKQKRTNHHYLLTNLSIILFVIFVELLQAGIVGRHARLLDALFAILNGGLGAILAAMVYEKRNNLLLFCRFAIVVVNVSLIWTLYSANSGGQLSNWNCDYPLVLANEATNDRPWLGKLHGFAIYLNELDAGQIRLLEQTPFTSKGETLRKSMGAIVWIVADNQGNIPTLKYYKSENQSESVELKLRKLDITTPVTITNPDIGNKMCIDILRQQIFTVEVLISKLDLSHTGLARIISNSLTPGLRNFTLGQEEGDIVFRVRSLRNGVNGTKLAIRTRGNKLRSKYNHIVATYSQGRASIILNGKDQNRSVNYNKVFLLSNGTPIFGVWRGY